MVASPALLQTKKKIMKAINLARFTKKTVKEVKSNDMRKQILSARDANSKEYTGLSRDLN